MRELKISLFGGQAALIFLLIPFLRPMGFNVGPIRTVWLAFSCFLIVLFAIKYYKIIFRDNSMLVALLFYFFIMATITVVKVPSISEGFEKLIAAPVLCICYAIWMKIEPKIAIKATVNILLVEQIICLLTWNVGFEGNATNSFTFIGVRTLLGIVGLISIFLGVIYNSLPGAKKWKGYTLIVLSIIQIYFRWISTAVLGLTVWIIVYWVLTRRNQVENIAKSLLNAKTLLIVAAVANVIMVTIQASGFLADIISGFLGESLTLNGRTIIWARTIPVVLESPITGYGVYGVRIGMSQYWGDGNTSFNYVHNQLLQVLLDGGILLVAAFIIAHIVLAINIDRIKDRKMHAAACATMFALLLAMITEEPANYLFYFPFICIAGNLYQCCEYLKEW